uniref:Uncharacterized protein n=1 Tax=Mustela putorius furo TaxID=9669 RepID=M3YGP7_MUSPF
MSCRACRLCLTFPPFCLALDTGRGGDPGPEPRTWPRLWAGEPRGAATPTHLDTGTLASPHLINPPPPGPRTLPGQVPTLLLALAIQFPRNLNQE